MADRRPQCQRSTVPDEMPPFVHGLPIEADEEICEILHSIRVSRTTKEKPHGIPRKTTFTGKAGKAVRFTVFPLGTRFRKISGLYLIACRGRITTASIDTKFSTWATPRLLTAF